MSARVAALPGAGVSWPVASRAAFNKLYSLLPGGMRWPAALSCAPMLLSSGSSAPSGESIPRSAVTRRRTGDPESAAGGVVKLASWLNPQDWQRQGHSVEGTHTELVREQCAKPLPWYVTVLLQRQGVIL
jgi:hypothetical protein